MKRIKNNRYVAGFLSLIVLFSIIVPQVTVLAAESKTYDFGLFQINVTLNESNYIVGSNDVDFVVSPTMNIENEVTFSIGGVSKVVPSLVNTPQTITLNNVAFTDGMTELTLNIDVNDGANVITRTNIFAVGVNANVQDALTNYHSGANVKISDVFPDKNLASAFASWIRKSSIEDTFSKADVMKETKDTFYATFKNINNLKGIEVLKDADITGLYLSGNQISNVDDLSWLTETTKLDIGKNKLTNIDGLRNLKKINQLILSNNTITDISPLQGIEVSNLHLQNNSISNIAALNHITTISVLDLSNNLIEDISPLSNLVTVSGMSSSANKLLLNNNKIKNVDGLQSLKIVDGDLHLQNNQISNVNGLSNLTEVKGDFYLNINLLTSVDGLQNLKTVYYSPIKGDLDLSKNNLINVDGLNNLIKVRSLVLSDNPALANINGISNLQEADNIKITNGSIKNVDSLSNIKTLANLTLSQVPLLNLNGLANLTEVTNEIVISETNLVDLRGLDSLGKINRGRIRLNSSLENVDGLHNLKTVNSYLWLDENNLKNIEGLQNLTDVGSDLVLSVNKLESIAPLSNLAKVNSLQLGRNNLTSLDGLKNTITIFELQIQQNNITSLDSLKGMTMCRFDASNNRITDMSPLLDVTSGNCGAVKGKYFKLTENFINPSEFRNKEALTYLANNNIEQSKQEKRLTVFKQNDYDVIRSTHTVYKHAVFRDSDMLRNVAIEQGKELDLFIPILFSEHDKNTNGYLSSWNELDFGLPIYVNLNPSELQDSLYDPYTPLEAYNFNSTNPDVAYIDNNTHQLKTNKLGTTTITVSLWNLKTSFTSYSFDVEVIEPTKSLKKIDVTPPTATINKGDTQQYTAIATYSDNSTADVTNASTWSIDDTTKATINAAGLATGTNAGDVVVAATYQGMNDTANLKVLAPTVIDLNVIPANATIKEGETQQYRAIATYSDNSIVDVTNASTWNTADNTISTVNVTGLAIGLKAGKTKVMATFSGLTDDADLTVLPVLQSLTVSPKSATIEKGDTQQYAATAHYSDGSDVVVTNSSAWTIDDNSKATINNSGLATGTNEGNVIVTATYEGMSDTATLKITVTPPPPPPPPVKTLTSLDVTPPTATINKGDTQQYTAIATYSDNSTADITNAPTWSIDDTKKATINAAGLATGANTGDVVVTATYQGMSDTANLKVLAPTVIDLFVLPENATIKEGETQQYRSIARYSDNSTADVTNASTWNTADNTISTLNATGLASGLKAGKTKVTATFSGLTDDADLTVLAVLQSLIVSPKSATIEKGDTQQYTATAHYSDGSNVVVTNSSTWSIDDNSKATINNSGLATGTNEGNVIVTATYEGMSDTASLTIQYKEKDPVIPIPKTMTGLSVTPKSAEIKVGEFQLYQAIATYSDLTTKDITNEAIWNSSDTSISTVEKGKANGLKKGKVDITATYNGLSDQAILTVTENSTGGGGDPIPQLIHLELKPKEAEIKVGQTQEYQAIAIWNNGVSKDVTLESTWNAANKEIATLEGHKALGIKKGQTTIIVSYENLTDNGILKVIDNTTPKDNPKEVPEPPASPDKFVVDVTPKIQVKEKVRIGETVQATIDIRNIGKDDVIDSFNNRLYAKKKESLLASREPLPLAKAEEWVLITRFTVEGGLTAGESKVVTVPLTFNEHGEYLLKIVSDEEMIVVNDINRDNNKDETVTVTVGDPIGTPKEESPIPRITPKVPKTGDGSINKNYDSELLVGLLLFSLFTSFIARRRLVRK